MNALLPTEWFASPAKIEFDDDEIQIIGNLAGDAPIHEFRSSSRADRMAIADQLEARFNRRVSWGVEQRGVRTLFTTPSPPITTRLRLSERVVLDTLVNAGVARSRSDALGWCVKLVGQHEAEWLANLRGALIDVARVRDAGPTSR